MQMNCLSNLSHSISSGKYIIHVSCTAINPLICFMDRVSYCGTERYLTLSARIFFLAPLMRSLRKLERC